jgi:colicin import membrane protein
VAVLLHAGLIWFLLTGVEPEKKSFKAKMPQFVDAKLVKIKAQSTVKPKPKPAAKPKVKPKPIIKPKPIVKPKPKPKPALKPKVDQQAVDQKALELKKQQRLEQLQKEREQQLLAALEDEDDYQQASSNAELATSYSALIRDQVAQHWSRPPSARNDMEVLLQIHLVPTGEVASVEILQGSGSAVFDQSALRAVNKAERFVELQDLSPALFEQYFRRFNLLFRPEDLRL